MEELVLVEILALIEEEQTQNPVVILLDKKNNKILPIWIGDFEARAIAVILNRAMVPRPLTHQLLSSAIAQMGGKVEKVAVDRVKNHTYYATIYVQRDKEIVKIDGRPSDAIALALNSNAPIYVSRDVMDKAGQENPFPMASVSLKQEGPRKIELSREDLERVSEVLKRAQEREQMS